MFRRSSNRAFSSTRHTACLPSSAVCDERRKRRRRVAGPVDGRLQRGRPSGRARPATNASTLVSKASYGWWTRMSRRRICASSSAGLRFSERPPRDRLPRLVLQVGPVELDELAQRRAGRAARCFRTPASRRSRARASACRRAPAAQRRATSRRTTSPKRRRDSCVSIASSSRRRRRTSEKSASRVIRNTACASISAPTIRGRKCMIASSIARTCPSRPTSRKRGRSSGTFTRTKRRSPLLPLRAITPTFSASEGRYGNGADAGRPRSGSGAARSRG